MELKGKSIGKNAIVNGIKTLFSVIFPLITYPYVATVLKVDNLGSYSFSYSVINYFYLFASLGIATYAIREGAKYRNSATDFSYFASEVFTINIASTILSYFLLAVVVLTVPKLHLYATTIAILSITMCFTLIGCEWVYSVYEEYTYIALRNIIFQFISMIFLLLLVKSENDVNVYAGIIVFAASGAQLVNFISLKKYCRIRPTISKTLLKHVKPIMVLFASTLAISIYVSSDTTILGFLSGDYHVGLYSVSTKVYTIVKQVMSGIIIVSIPRLSFYLGNGMNDRFKELCDIIVDALTVIILPAMVGIICLSKEIIIFISNETYVDSRYSLIILGGALVACLYNWFFTSCVLIPNKKEEKVLYATLVAAAVNIGLNFVIIPSLKENGAAITTLIAETCSLVICGFYSRSIYRIRISSRNLVSVGLGCIYVTTICLVCKNIVHSYLLVLLLSLSISAAGYVLIELLLKNTISIQMLGRVKGIISRMAKHGGR